MSLLSEASTPEPLSEGNDTEPEVHTPFPVDAALRQMPEHPDADMVPHEANDTQVASQQVSNVNNFVHSVHEQYPSQSVLQNIMNNAVFKNCKVNINFSK